MFLRLAWCPLGTLALPIYRRETQLMQKYRLDPWRGHAALEVEAKHRQNRPKRPEINPGDFCARAIMVIV